mmetsp:Transcript_11266/g.19992  ORF Transcript_11266/g.19992 Transcript_11266/m.19992 type:complete len:152 (-) Transcript_11266:7-462(-)
MPNHKHAVLRVKASVAPDANSWQYPKMYEFDMPRELKQQIRETLKTLTGEIMKTDRYYPQIKDLIENLDLLQINKRLEVLGYPMLGTYDVLDWMDALGWELHHVSMGADRCELYVFSKVDMSDAPPGLWHASPGGAYASPGPPSEKRLRMD